MTTKASDNSGNRVTIQSSIEDILGYELALHIFRMLKIEESAQEASINNIAELHELLSDRAENLSYVQSQAEFQGLDKEIQDESAIAYAKSLASFDIPPFAYTTLEDLTSSFRSKRDSYRSLLIDYLELLKAAPFPILNITQSKLIELNQEQINPIYRASREYLKNNFKGRVEISFPRKLELEKEQDVCLKIIGYMEEADLPYLINKKDREFYLPQLLKKCAAKLIANENLCSIQPHNTVKGTVEEKRGGSFSYEAEWSITALKEAPQTIKAHVSILSAPSTADLNKLMESEGFNCKSAMGPSIHIDVSTPIFKKKSFRYLISIGIALVTLLATIYYGAK